MKVSFGLLSVAKEKQHINKSDDEIKKAFFEADLTPKNNFVREKVLEIRDGIITAEKGDKVYKNRTGQSVIPCTNKLENLAKEKKELKVIVGELKYGLNIVSREIISKPKNAPISIPVQDKIKNRTRNDKSEEQVKNPTEDIRSDENIAKLILKDVEKAKLYEELFGTSPEEDLVEKASKTVPILLRKEKNNSESLKTGDKAESGVKLQIKPSKDTKAIDYENVPVEQFGLAMLLGMGFDPENSNVQPKVYKKRVYDRAGLGADFVMKDNMESLMDASLMAKLKKDQMYSIRMGDGGKSQNRYEKGVENWVSVGLFVKIIDKGHAHYKRKGVVRKVDADMATIIIDNGEVRLNCKYLETVVGKDAKKCKVVREIANYSGKSYVPIGTIVDVHIVHSSFAKIIFRAATLSVSLDDICEFENS